MFKAECSYHTFRVTEIDPTRVTEKTVTVGGRRENKVSLGRWTKLRWFDTHDEALDWLKGLAKADKKSAEESFDEAESRLETIASWRGIKG